MSKFQKATDDRQYEPRSNLLQGILSQEAVKRSLSFIRYQKVVNFKTIEHPPRKATGRVELA